MPRSRLRVSEGSMRTEIMRAGIEAHLQKDQATANMSSPVVSNVSPLRNVLLVQASKSDVEDVLSRQTGSMSEVEPCPRAVKQAYTTKLQSPCNQAEKQQRSVDRTVPSPVKQSFANRVWNAPGNARNSTSTLSSDMMPMTRQQTSSDREHSNPRAVESRKRKREWLLSSDDSEPDGENVSSTRAPASRVARNRIAKAQRTSADRHTTEGVSQLEPLLREESQPLKKLREVSIFVNANQTEISSPVLNPKAHGSTQSGRIWCIHAMIVALTRDILV